MTFRGPPLDFTKIKKKLPKNYILDSNSNIVLTTTPHTKLGANRPRASSLGSSSGSSSNGSYASSKKRMVKTGSLSSYKSIGGSIASVDSTTRKKL